MTTNDKIRDETLQCDINKKAAKISALSSGKIGKHKYQMQKYSLLTKDKQQNKLSFHIFLQEKLLKNKTKTIKEQERK